jgi:hypothetical protein
MNERIRELAEQARAESSQWLGSKPAITITYDEFEKFAELIVKECIKVAGTEMGYSQYCAMREKLEEHFGVK